MAESHELAHVHEVAEKSDEHGVQERLSAVAFKAPYTSLYKARKLWHTRAQNRPVSAVQPHLINPRSESMMRHTGSANMYHK